MHARITTVFYLLPGLINFFPVLGLAGRAKLEALYGVSLSSADLLLLMQHRALLFGIVGGIMIYAAFKPVYRKLSAIVGLISMVGFEVLYLLNAEATSALGRLAAIDAVATLVLLVAVWRDRNEQR